MQFKTRIRNVITLVSVLLITFTFMSTLQAHAAPPPRKEFTPPTIPPVITLLEQTPLYATTDESRKPFAALTPQDVTTVEAEQDWYTKQRGEKVWIKIKTTWAGDLWMHLNYDRIGIVKPLDTNIALLWDSYLYTQPSLSTRTDAVLAPQTVHANAVFESPASYLTNSYRIETSWLGDMWVVSQPQMLLDMEIVNQEMDLPTETLYMENYDTSNRLQRPSEVKMIPPQKVFALEKTQTGVYHVRSQDGNTFWIQPEFAEPVGAGAINERLTLSKDVRLYLFPTMPFPTFGVLSAQTVDAFERWTDPQGERWYHIHTWAGDMWVQPDKPL